MRGSLVLIAALCVVAAAEASSVRFISVDEGQNGKDKAHRSEVSEGTDPVVQKKVEDAVKKINDGEEELEKTVKSLDVERSGGKTSESDGEGAKKAASSEKSKVHKRDVRRALEQLAKRGMKRTEAEEVNILSARKIIVKYLSLQKAMTSKVAVSLIFAVEQLETDQMEKEALIAALKTFQKDVEQAYDNTINALGPQYVSGTHPSDQNKFMRADDIPALMTAMNQRNPFAIIPFVLRLINGIAGAASIADMANSMGGNRSNLPDMASVMETVQRFLSMGSIPENF